LIESAHETAGANAPAVFVLAVAPALTVFGSIR